jgi:homoserine trans-succinylase
MSFVTGLLNQTITGIYSVAKDRYGTPTKTLSLSSVSCRWQEKVQKVISQSGESVVSTIECWIEPSVSISESYEILKDSTTSKIVAYTKHYSLTGTHEYTKLYLV